MCVRILRSDSFWNVIVTCREDTMATVLHIIVAVSQVIGGIRSDGYPENTL